MVVCKKFFIVLGDYRHVNGRNTVATSIQKEEEKMKRTRKGFTLVELIIVIGIISILGVMSIMGGGEVTNAATASKIIEEFKTLSSAMNMYYADNKILCDKGITAANIKTGLATYVKSTDIIVTDKAAAGKYYLSVLGNTDWYLTYTLNGAATKVGQILKNKSAQEVLYSKVPTKVGDAHTAYDGGATVVFKVK